jgi:hypothetical protein
MERDDFGPMTDAEWRTLSWESRPARRKVSEETWAMIRRGWEQGQTGASLAQRFEVGLANLWRRRASEGWRRPKAEDRKPEPLEGWAAHVDARVKAFELQLATERLMARRLAEALTGDGRGEMPLWHLGFVMHWRAEQLGDEVARDDRERSRGEDWAGCVWDDDGRLLPLVTCDLALMQAHRPDLMEELALPEAAGRWLP